MTWVEDRIYAAGGEHIPRTWAEFAHQTGIAAVLHLRPGAPTSFQGPPPEAYLWLGLEDETEAGPAERWLAAAFVRDSLGAGHKVLIHSSLGRHRTRWIFVAWAIVDGRSIQAALRQAAARPWLSPYPTQPEAWEAFAREVRRASRRPAKQGRTHALQ
ncbi:MAG: dual specificity protein phosphatase family protein [Chloroflexi bacterium]|nr:dual specificity protein phosphatase family protein [Chloroflexota bacterium]